MGLARSEGGPMRHLLPALALALTACATSAPYTGAAAAINTGLALGVGAAGRAEGGCWAQCTGGLACNPATGWCEKPKPVPLADCPPGAAAGDQRCRGWPAPTVRHAPPAGPAGGGAPGVSPATGSTPPPPADATPGGPPKP
jgi:hypothetical protein